MALNLTEHWVDGGESLFDESVVDSKPAAKPAAPSPTREELVAEAKTKYGAMARFLLNNLHIVRILSQTIASEDQDKLCDALVGLFMGSETISAARVSFPFVRTIIEEEFRVNHSRPATILRVGSTASRIMSVFCRQAQRSFMQTVLSEFIRTIIDDRRLNFEIDEVKLKASITKARGTEPLPEELQAALERNLSLLKRYTQRILDRIISEPMLACMPREMRALAYIVRELAEKTEGAPVIPLIGNSVMLRGINPCIVTPEAFGLLREGELPIPQARRNLVLVSKVLQSLSNGVPFGAKEPYMVPMNDFVSENMKSFQSYLLSVTVDPLADDEREPWQELIKAGNADDIAAVSSSISLSDEQRTKKEPSAGNRKSAHEAVTEVDIRVDRDSNQKKNCEAVEGQAVSKVNGEGSTLQQSSEELEDEGDGEEEEALPLGRFSDAEALEVNLKKAIQLHRLLHGKATEVKLELGPESAGKLSTILANIGDPLDAARERALYADGDTNAGSKLQQLRSPPKHIAEAIRSSKFCYVGSPSLAGRRVVYVICWRLPVSAAETSSGIEALVQGDTPVIDEPVDVVVDLSFSDQITTNLSDSSSFLGLLLSGLSPAAVRVLRTVLLVHPARAVRELLLRLKEDPPLKPPREMRLHTAGHWKHLRKYINEKEIMLPKESKDCLPGYFLQLVRQGMARRKVQSIMLCFTPTALLVVAAKSRKLAKIVFETSAKEVVQVISGDAPLEVRVRYKQSRTTRPGLLSRLSLGRGAKDELRFLCRSIPERDALASDVLNLIVEAGKSPKAGQTYNYEVTKVNRYGRAQDRSLIVATDCILNLNKKAVSSFIPFSSIMAVQREEPEIRGSFAAMDAASMASRIYLYIDKEDNPRLVLVSKSLGETLEAEIREGIGRYRREMREIASLASQSAHDKYFELLSSSSSWKTAYGATAKGNPPAERSSIGSPKRGYSISPASLPSTKSPSKSSPTIQRKVYNNRLE